VLQCSALPGGCRGDSGKFFRGAGEDGGDTQRDEATFVNALGDICRRYGTNAQEITFSQYFLYIRAAEKAKVEEFKESAMASRLAMASQDGWKDFMNALNGEEIAKAKTEFIEGLKDKPIPEPNSRLAFEGITPPRGE
jgi:hypothetical protein